ncbi:Gcn5-related N-acetyltransferase (GNAT) domain ATAT-type [Trinorchestia longiramus]|nr:Gcn5-related N-acetyltransferase (GNAT) domain ATAT-type [Trinorchestia longiramus]
MEFRFDVRNILLEDISKVDNSLIIKGWNSKTRYRVEYQQLYEIINTIGEASAFAQGLSNVITTSEKLQNSDHLLYLLKEDDPTSRATMVVGMLKIGRKKLFLLDQDRQTKEVAPLCVLDFYVHESRQRRGYGKRLFDAMLRDQGVEAGHMAVDKPSEKFLGFLKKHYKLVTHVPQINNFVVFDTFFDERPISSEEQQMTAVNRSRGGSRTGSQTGSRAGSRAGSRGGSPELPSTPNSTSPSTTRRLSNANNLSNPAGKPTHGPRHSAIYVGTNDIQFATFHPSYPTTILPLSYRPPPADILHGRVDRHTPAAHKNPRFQPTLEWMKTEGGGPSFYSRTSSNAGSPRSRTPLAGSPPATPPRGTRTPVGADESDAAHTREASIAPTPATSPIAGRPSAAVEPESVEEVNGVTVNGGDAEVENKEDDKKELNGAVDEHVEELAEELKSSSLAATPPRSPGKTGSWRDSIARNSESVISHISKPDNEGTSAGVLKDNESVHGHLKFHHHKLW